MAKNPYKHLGYNCKNCGSYLRSAGTFSDYLVCPKCFSSYYSKDLEKEINEEIEKIDKIVDEMPNWERSFLKNGWKDGEQGMSEYDCPSCGAMLICDEATAATACPYCDSHAIIRKRLSGAYKPDFVLPFKLSREDAMNILANYLKNSPLLPKDFVDKIRAKDMNGVFVPYWVFENSSVEAKQYYYGRRFHQSLNEAKEPSRNEYFHIYRTGEMKFEKIILDASEKMPDTYMEAVSNYDLTELKPFSPAYLTGFFAEKFDINMPDTVLAVEGAFEETISMEMKKNVAAEFDSVELKNEHIEIGKGTVKYMMLPVWILNTKWNDEDYTFAINGQTGRIIGRVPTCPKRRAALFAKVAAPLLLASALLCFAFKNVFLNYTFVCLVLSIVLPCFVAHTICERMENSTWLRPLPRGPIEAKPIKGLKLTEKIDDYDRCIESSRPK